MLQPCILLDAHMLVTMTVSNDTLIESMGMYR